MTEAIGTSLFVIAVQSSAGLLGHLHSVHMRWPLTLAVTAAAIAGSLLGARLVGRIPQAALRTAFGTLVAAMAAFIVLQQLPALRHWLIHPPVGPAALGTVAIAVVAVAVARIRSRRRSAHPAGQDPHRRAETRTPTR
jgi:hypothetical protein